VDDGAQYLYGARLEAMKQSGSRLYYLADGLGSTMAIVNATGTVQNSYAYDVYGKPTVTGSVANEFDFAGQQTDATGLQYLRARYMDPETGTFLSRDPLVSVRAWTGNGFGYASGRPSLLTDPSGLCNYPGDPTDPWCKDQKSEPDVHPDYEKEKNPNDPIIDVPGVIRGAGDAITDAFSEWIKLNGEYELRKLQGQQALAESILDALKKLDSCAADQACSLAVEAVLQSVGGTMAKVGLATGNPALASAGAALMTVGAAWGGYSAWRQAPTSDSPAFCVDNCPLT
jgi:RHS repeat-associated protein